jgi:rubrerythrin
MLGPAIIGATPRLHEYTSQAWAEGTGGESDPQEKVGTEDAHEEEETNRERWERLMSHADRVWRCVGCGGQAFSDRSTLQRHCKSAMHRKQRDLQKCPLCPKKYLRLSNLRRHMDQKHEGVGEGSKRSA